MIGPAGKQTPRGTGRHDYGPVHRFLRWIQRPLFVPGWWIEQQCSWIEMKGELHKWNHKP